MSTERSVRVAIIGTGNIARRHIRHYKEIPWIDVAAIVDVIPGKALAFAKTHGIPEDRVYEDHRLMLEKANVEGVSVCTHNMAHRAPAVDALNAGKHVLLEKPMAATLEDAKAIMRAADASGKILMVGFQPDFTTQYKVAKQVIQSGALGHIYYAESITFRRWGIAGGPFLKKAIAGAGTLVDTGVYALHNTLSLMGDPKPVAVSAITANFLATGVTGVASTWAGSWRAEEVEVEDFAAAFVRFENGAAMVFKSCWAANADSVGRPFFLGSKGGMALNPRGTNPPVELYFNQMIGDLNITASPQGLPEVDEWPEKIRRFSEAVRDNLPSPIDPHGVFLVNVVMDGVLRSAELGREVTVDCRY